MGSHVFRCHRPYSTEDEAQVVRFWKHGCRGRCARDELLFPIGMFGQGMPLEVPFEVQSSEECAACGVIVKTWAQWTGGRIIDLSAGR